MIELHDLKSPKGSHRSRFRKGRGPGSGNGKTAGRGHKGAKARTGSGGPGGGKPFFEGGQLPLQRRLPKRGFTPLKRTRYQVVNLAQLDTLGQSEVGPAELVAAGLVRRAADPVKVLGNGELTRTISISAHAFSKAARAAIEAQGGTAEELR